MGQAACGSSVVLWGGVCERPMVRQWSRGWSVELPWSAKNAAKLSEMGRGDPLLLSLAGPTFLMLGPETVSLGYLRYLAEQGYVGLQAIPRASIARGVR